MSRLVLLDPRIHRDLKVDPAKVEAHGAFERSVPVVLSEFQKLAVQYPILITKNTETGQFVCVSIFGFEEGENLFWQDGTWNAIYVPLNVTRQPFFAGENDSAQEGHEQDQFVVCVDVESDSVQEVGGEALFDESGAATDYLQRMQSTLAQLLEGEAQTRKFLQKLKELNLLTPMTLEITFVNDQPQRVAGAYTIDETRLQGLSQEALFELHSQGYLHPIYAMIVSLGQLYSLIEKKNASITQGSQWFKQPND
jgi:hypothetical protein